MNSKSPVLQILNIGLRIYTGVLVCCLSQHQVTFQKSVFGAQHSYKDIKNLHFIGSLDSCHKKRVI